MTNNYGWRYVLFSGGSIVFLMSVLRVTVIRLRETPKYQLGMGKERELVDTLHDLARKYNRRCSLTVEKLERCGKVHSTHAENRFSAREAWMHVRGLFATKKMSLSTTLIWLSWTCIGLAYPLFQVFLP